MSVRMSNGLSFLLLRTEFDYLVRIEYSIVHDDTQYLLKCSVYDWFSNFTPITSYQVSEKKSGSTGYFDVNVTVCKEMNATVWPVTSQGLGESVSSHFEQKYNMHRDSRCRLDSLNNHLCDTLSINSANVTFHDVEPTCNTDQLELQTRFDIGDIGDMFPYRGGPIPRCRDLHAISVYYCPVSSVVQYAAEYVNNLSESSANSCDNSRRFCKSFQDPMRDHVGRYRRDRTLVDPCKPAFVFDRDDFRRRKNFKMVMHSLRYAPRNLNRFYTTTTTIYKLIFVLQFKAGNRWPLPNSDYQTWMANTETTYEYYLRSYADQEECKKASKKSNRVIYTVIGTTIPLILVVIATGMVIYRRSRKKQSNTRRFNGSMELREERYHDMIRCTSDDDIFEIDCERVVIFKDQVLGQGAFGKVYKGKIKGLTMTSFHATSKLTDNQERAENMLVAVKQCYEFADAATKREFLREILVMKELYQHDSLVNILHCITQYPHKPFSLIVEYCQHGDLLKFLQNSKVYLEELQNDERDKEKIILFDDVARITFEVADGMAYLTEKGYIHRDLAARNIMVKKGKHVKIGDFGLCRSVVSQDDVCTTKGGRLPIKWMAIESLYDYQFSTKSDVWSYGVLLYEITTLGLQPYADIVPQDGDFRRAMISHLRSGARLEQPLSCPNEIYAIMKRTWAEKPEHRASFAEIRETARRLVESLHDLDGGVYGDRYVGVEVNRCDQSDVEEFI